MLANDRFLSTKPLDNRSKLELQGMRTTLQTLSALRRKGGGWSGIRLIAGPVSPVAVLGACTHHPVYENDVLSAFPASMQSAPDATQDLAQAGLLQHFCTRKIPEWQTEFMTKYPSLFSDSEMQKWGLECGRGWEGLIRETCNELKGKNITFTQIKEKFGRLRIYVRKADKETRRYLEEMEEKSGKVCENCGRTGDMAISNGWLFATCEECAKQQGRDFSWLEDA